MSVYLSEPISPKALKKLKEKVEVVDTFDKPEEIEGIILLYLPVDKKVMDACSNLKVIGKHGVGCDSIDLEEAKKRGITVVNTPKANAESVAEFIVGLILDAAKNISTSQRKTKEGDFESTSPTEMTGIELRGKTLGLIGAGNIARTVARILSGGFGMKVIAYDPYLSKKQLESLGFEPYENLNDMVENADIVNISVPLTKETTNLVSVDTLSHFKKNAFLINAARGGVVNEDDLYEALKNGELRGAACDCFVHEPPTLENTRLFSLDNFVGTPHTASVTEEALERMADQVVEEVLAVLEGSEPENRVV